MHRRTAEIKAWGTGVFTAFPKLKLEIKSLVVAGDSEKADFDPEARSRQAESLAWGRSLQAERRKL